MHRVLPLRGRHFPSRHIRARCLHRLALAPSSLERTQRTLLPAIQSIRPTLPLGSTDTSLLIGQFRHFSTGDSSNSTEELQQDLSATPKVPLIPVVDDDEDDFVSDELRYNFRGKLNNWYKANFDVSIKDCFDCKLLETSLVDRSAPSQQLWTASFTCPITGHVSQASFLPGAPFAQTHDRRTYFPTKKLANQSAAMNALHCHCPDIAQQPPSGEPLDPFRFGAIIAKSQLQLWYMQHHKVVFDDNLVVETETMISKGKQKGGTWWTACFRCPVTGTRFPAMELFDYEQRMQEEGRFWYRRKGDAIHAALARAMVAKHDTVDSLSEEELMGYCTNQSQAVQLLSEWFQKRHHTEITKDNFVASMGSWKGSGGNRWTASFICPLTGNRYDSGALRKVDVALTDGGTHWYARKDDAIIAAALRAYDVMQFELNQKAEPRFCTDHPSTFHEGVTKTVDGEAPEEDPQIGLDNSEDVFSLGKSQGRKHDVETLFSNELEGDSSFGLLKKSSFFDLPTEPASAVTPTSEASWETESSYSAEESADELDEDDEDNFVIQFIPQRVGKQSQDTSVAPTALDIVAQTWIEKGRPLTASSSPSASEKNTCPQQERQNAIDRALTWVEHQRDMNPSKKQSRTLFDDRRNATRLTIGKMLLEALATSHQRVPAERDTHGVEKAAKQILDLLWASPSTAPDSDCYASYINCLEGSPTRVTAKATKIWNAMTKTQEYDGRFLPAPTTAVFNSVIRRRAEAGVKTPLSDLEGRNPNRESFLACLSAIAHASGSTGSGFDTQYILDCLQAMKTTETETPLEHDIDVYNAPMRWSGGTFGAHTRPYSRCIPWDDLTTRFLADQDKALHFSEQDPLVREAYALDNWLDAIDNNAFGANIKANIETYESVIQAWIRTGTLEGIQKAEDVLKRVLSSDSVTLRLQTFHPLLVASAYLGDTQRVESLVRVMADAGISTDDSRIQLIPLLARASRKSTKNVDGTDNLELIQSIIESYKEQPGQFVDAKVFALSIEALCKCGLQNPTSRDDYVFGIMKAVEAFDDFALYIYKNTHDDSRQLQHLAANAAIVYSQAFASLRDLDTDGKNSREIWNWADKIIRRTDEYRILQRTLASASTSNVSSEPVMFDDGFDYRYEAVLRNPRLSSWSDFYTLLIKTMADEAVSSEGRAAECVRLCLQIAEFMREGAERDFETDSHAYRDVAAALDGLAMGGPLLSQVKEELAAVLGQHHTSRSKRQQPVKHAHANASVAKKDFNRRRRKRSSSDQKHQQQRPRNNQGRRKRMNSTA
eukprot:Nitzschia sp. Nitz4//scaffold33_size148984//100710//104567//NITZ4_002938-RA/size148984-processed-gene-0.176-mRNA-1//-1//CDS//3329548457//2970//frame0